MATKTYSLYNNSRFYVLITAVLLSGMVFSILRLSIASDQLLSIRAQQIYGLLAVVYLYIALIISPIGHIVGKQRTAGLGFARRAIGVSAFYFAALHGAIAVWGQLGGLAQLAYLPSIFVWSLAAGTVTFIILGLMAATSFDRVVRIMTYKKWKWLHRLVYAGALLALLHIWTIGTHLAYSGVQIAGLAAVVLLLGLELYRFIGGLNEKYFKLAKTEFITVFVTVWLIASVGVAALPSVVQNYHGRHTDHEAGLQLQGYVC